MKTNLIIVMSMALIFTLPSFTFAAHHGSGHGCMMSSWDMTELDADNDREISFEEYAEPHMKTLRKGYDMIDLNKDGFINETEWEELKRVHGVDMDQ
jgi:hypothetical protein